MTGLTGLQNQRLETVNAIIGALAGAYPYNGLAKIFVHSKNFDRISSDFQPIHDRHEVNSLFEHGRQHKKISFKDFNSGKYLYLPMPRRERCLPILACHFPFDTGIFQTRVMFFRENLDGELQSLGVRFEMGQGNHEFAHAQMFNITHPNKLPEDSLPEEQPSIPLYSSNTDLLDVFIAAMVSVYGSIEARNILRPPLTSDSVWKLIESTMFFDRR